MTKIILNADDFGKSPERNKAIDYAFKQGLICSAGMIVTGKYLQDAINYISHGDYVKNIHIHFNFSTSPIRISEGSEDAPLTDAMKMDSYYCMEGKFKPYKGIPQGVFGILKWKIVYREMVAQYNKFMEITHGEADYKHIDFHLWYNLSWPVSVALNVFTRKYKIESVRYIGMHHLCMSKHQRLRKYRIISWNPRVKFIPATNIDYYLSERDKMTGFDIIELYCHPNYKEGVFLDDSPSYLKHERQPMLKQIQMLKDTKTVDFISWEDA